MINYSQRGDWRFSIRGKAMILALLSIGHLSRPLDAISQPSPKPTVLATQLSCTTCRIVVKPGVVLGNEDGEGIFDRIPSRALIGEKGHIFVAVRPGRSLAYEFDSSGRFIRRIGRHGHGPGEYEEATGLLKGLNDSIVILDIRQLRRSVLSPAGKFVRSTPMPLQSVLALQMRNGQQIVFSSSGSSEQVGRLFHVIDNVGSYVRSFGDAPMGAVMTDGQSRGLLLAPSQGNTFWAHSYVRYVVQRWDQSGRLLSTLVRNAPWFRTDVPISTGQDGTRPTGTFVGVREDNQGVLWTVVNVASDNWQKALGSPTIIRGSRNYRNIRNDLLFDSIVEAIDPIKGEVIQSIRIPGLISLFASDRTVGKYYEDGAGIPRLQLLHLELARGSAARD